MAPQRSSASKRRHRKVRAKPKTAAARRKCVVYVHGICRHEAGYSDPWWNAMKRYVPSVTDRLEVLWSDLVNVAARRKQLLADPRAAFVKQAVADILIDRARRE